MRVLFWSDLFWPYLGGVETQAAGLLPALRERGFEIVVLTSHRDGELPDEEEWRGIRVHRLPFWQALQKGDPGAFLSTYKKARKLVEGCAPDLVHLNSVAPSATYCQRIMVGNSIPMLVSLHQELRVSQRNNGETMLSKLLERADWLHGVSRTVLDQGLKQAPSLRERSSVILNYVEPPELEPAPFPISPNILCLGRLIPQKGFDLALEAFAAVAGRFPEARLTLAGDGTARETLEQQARGLGVENWVAFTGMMSPKQVFALINDSVLVLMPSRFEGFGVVAVESAVMGRPVIAANVGGLRDVIETERTGLLVPPEDPSALAGAIERLLSDPGFAERLGHQARRRALDLYGKQSCVDAYESLYRRFAKSGHRSSDPGLTHA